MSTDEWTEKWMLDKIRPKQPVIKAFSLPVHELKRTQEKQVA